MAGLDLYQVLGIPRDAAGEEIRNAYFEAARRYHPDANPDSSAREHFLIVQEAYEVLSHPEKKAEYDALLPPAPPPPAIGITIKYSRTTLPQIDEPQLLYALVELICTADMDKTQYPPLHVCLVVDRSTSMQGNRIEIVKSNIRHLIRQMKPQDMISLVTFSDRSEVVIPLGRVADPLRMENRISQIVTGGGTELFQGLEAGLGQLMTLRGVKAIRQLILLTDGHTYGDEEACQSLAQRASEEGITLGALGIGHEWNDIFLDKLTSITGGNAVYVASPEHLTGYLERKLMALGMVYAKGISFEFSNTSDFQLRYAFRIHPESGPLQITSPIFLGDLMYGRALTFILEFYIPRLSPDVQEIVFGKGKLSMEIPTRAEGKARMYLPLKRPVASNPEPELPPSAMLDALSKLSLYRLQEKARGAVEEGNYAQATRHLQYLATHLLAMGNRDLAHTVLVEAEHIQQSRYFSKEGDKKIKYGTRSLLLPSGLEQV